MQIGVDKFSGKQLRDAIEFRMISQKKLASEIEVTPSNITKYLKGTLKPSPTVFEKIALALQFPKEFFLSSFVESDSDIFNQKQAPELWRSLKSTTKRARSRGKVILKWQIQIYHYFATFFDYPQFTHPEISVPDTFNEIDFDFIDDYCLKLREAWGLGNKPIGNLIRIIERNGVCVCRVNLENKNQDAVSFWDTGTPFVLLNSSVTSSARLRFNVAHELGHILLHRSVSFEDLEDHARFDEIEEQAHYFATSLLLPESPLSRDFWAPTLKCIESIKAKWNVSMQAIMRRSLELNLLTSAQFTYLNIALSRKGWRTKEPMDDITPIEIPRLFPQSLERLASDYSMKPSDISSTLSLPVSVAADICATDISYFVDTISPTDESIIPFHPQK